LPLHFSSYQLKFVVAGYRTSTFSQKAGQCFDTIKRVTGSASGPVPIISNQGFFSGISGLEENQRGTDKSRFIWKRAVKTEVFNSEMEKHQSLVRFPLLKQHC